MKYLKRDDVILQVEDAIEELLKFENFFGLALPLASKKESLNALREKLKSLEYIEIIHCEECEYFHKWPCQKNNPEIMGKLCTRGDLLTVDENDFCSRGELDG